MNPKGFFGSPAADSVGLEEIIEDDQRKDELPKYISFVHDSAKTG